MIVVKNTVEGKVVFTGNENEFIDFVKKIVIENEDHDYSVIGISDAEEYIEDYCGDLEWNEFTSEWLYSLEWFQTLPYQIIDKMFKTNLSRFLDRKLTDSETDLLMMELMSIEDRFMELTEEEVEERYKMVMSEK
jgi:hypothetical protein